MAFNPSPKVAAARDFANKFGQEMVIIVHIDRAGKIGYASYGGTQSLCHKAKVIADEMFDAITK